MRRLNRFADITLSLFFSLSLAALSSFSLLAQAQEPLPFEIRVIPQAEYAVSGQPFTYTITITNVSSDPLKDILVKVKTPAGSLYVESHFVNPKWFVGGVQRGQAGEIVWLTQEPMAPDEIMTFDLVVNVLPEVSGRQLINDQYSVVTINDGQTLASGPPITTQVLISTPTPLPTVEPTATPVPTVTSSPAPLSQAHSGLATLTSTPLAAFTPPPQISSLVTDTSPTTAQNATSGVSSNIFVAVSISLLTLVIAGLVWVWKRK